MGSLILLIAVSVLPAWAGNRVGNGGDVVVCEKDHKRARLLDFYEMESSDKALVRFKSESADTILHERIDQLRKVAPKLAEQYSKRAESLQKEMQFKTGIALTDVQDSEHAYLPDESGCSLRQIVIRQNVPVADKQFLVDQKLWNELSPGGRAGLIMHEVVYEHFYKLGETTSAKARRLNGLIFSPDLAAMSPGKFWLFVKNLEVPLYP